MSGTRQWTWGWQHVTESGGRFALDNLGANDFLTSLPENGVDFVFGSPPYATKASRYEGMPTFPDDPEEWAETMAVLTANACRASRGYVMWVVDSPRSKKTHEYQPAVEMLQLRLATTYADAVFRCTPQIWLKNAAPGGKYYPGHKWEFVLVYCGAGKTPAYNPDAIGTVSKYKGSGGGRQRLPDGSRNPPSRGWKNKGVRSRPSDVVTATVGGGHMGRKVQKGKHLVTDMVDDKLCSSGEAPFPWTLADHFVRGYSDPGDIVSDPFTGSGTTAMAALMNGRRFVGNDIRENQLALTRKRVSRIEGVL